jgi:hypothetical protein
MDRKMIGYPFFSKLVEDPINGLPNLVLQRREAESSGRGEDEVIYTTICQP